MSLGWRVAAQRRAWPASCGISAAPSAGSASSSRRRRTRSSNGGSAWRVRCSTARQACRRGERGCRGVGRRAMTMHSAPTQVRPARLKPLAKLPVFLDLAGKRAVVAGEGAPVVWKAELLAAAGAAVAVYAPRPDPELVALADGLPEVMLVRRSWRAADLHGAAFAVADIADAEEAERFAAAA